MNTTTIAVDLAKHVFQAHLADGTGKVLQRKRLTRHQFQKLLATSPVSTVVMEACGSAHYWGREAIVHGHTAKLLPAQHVKPYVRNNKTDAADADGLLRAHADKALNPVPIKSEDLQALQSLHRIRQKYENHRKALMNMVRGLLREFGVILPQGMAAFAAGVPACIDQVPPLLQQTLLTAAEQVQSLRQLARQIDRELARIARCNDTVGRLMTVPGVGVLNATALYAGVPNIAGYRSSRAFAASLGITPREMSSGETRYLGAITKRGNRHLRTLLIHGGRSVLLAARRKANSGQDLSRLESWGLDVAARAGHNKACVAVANKLARIVWAVWSKQTNYRP